MVREEAAEGEVNGLRAGLAIEREDASSLHFCCACVRSRGDRALRVYPPFPKHHRSRACIPVTNGRVRKAERRRTVCVRLHVAPIIQTTLVTVTQQATSMMGDLGLSLTHLSMWQHHGRSSSSKGPVCKIQTLNIAYTFMLF